MPPFKPPSRLCDDPALDYLPAGTTLWRVHHANLRPEEFSASPADSPWGGGRFDCTSADRFPFLYAALKPETALCETLLRPLQSGHGWRHLVHASVRNRVLSCLATTSDLTLLSLAETTHLLKVCQDTWLVHAEGLDYTGTRDWACWLRHHVVKAQGFVWCSRRNLPEHSLIFFGDRCPAGSIQSGPEPPMRLDDQHGAEYLNEHLAAYRVTIGVPGKASSRVHIAGP